MRWTFLALLLGCFLVANIPAANSYAVMSVDLGSEWMKIAIVKPGVPMEIVLNKESKRKTEAAVSMRDGERVFGSSARSTGVRFPASTYMFLQDLLGKSIDNPLVQQYMKRFPYYNIQADVETGGIHFVHDEEKNVVYTPEELMAMILNHTKSLAEDYAQTTIDSVVLTVPSFYNQAERKSLLHSAKLAGLKVAQLIDNNAAAGLNYGVFRRNDINGTAQYLMLYDMGSSSTTASILEYKKVKVNGITDAQLQVKGVGFDRTLGGIEIELRLRDHLVKLFNEKKKTKMDVTKNPRSMAKLLKEAKRVKKVLSANVDHMARIESLVDDEDFKAKVTRAELEEMCADLWKRVGGPVKQALEAADLTMDSINQIILIGGGTRVPKVQEVLLKESGKPDLGRNLNADEAAALGASYQAAALSSGFKVKTFHVRQSAAYPIEINFQRNTPQEDGSVSHKNIKRTLFQRSNPYPQRKVITFNRFTDDFQFSVNYGDMSYLGEFEQKVVPSSNITDVSLEGVKGHHDNHVASGNMESKGVKAHFRMDESGVLTLESVESVFEGNRTENVTVKADEPDESTLKTEEVKEKSEEAKEENKSEKVEKTEEKTAGDEKAASDKKDDEKAQPEEVVETKVVKYKKTENLTSVIKNLDVKKPTEENVEKSQQKLKELADIDAYKLAKEVALNKLETYIYEKKDKLYTEEYEEAMTEEERELITSKLNEASEWMEWLEEEVAPNVFDEKRKELKEVCRSWLLRVKTRKDVEPALADLETVFNYTSHFLKAIAAVPEEENIYTEVEIKTLVDTLNSTVQWKNETVKAESELKPYEDPLLKPADIKQKMDSLNREVGYLYNKAKNAKPKKKKTEKKEEDKAKSEEAEEKTKDSEEAAKPEEKSSEDKTAKDEKATATEEEQQTTPETPTTEKTAEKDEEPKTPRTDL